MKRAGCQLPWLLYVICRNLGVEGRENEKLGVLYVRFVRVYVRRRNKTGDRK